MVHQAWRCLPTAAALVVGLLNSQGFVSGAAQHPNVLFIAVDDLRPELGCYGDPKVKSPNLDRLAAGGLRFERAYCQQAVCSPSRTSLLTGRRPDTTRVYDLETHFRTTIPDVVTLPQHFKAHGYTTRGISKIFHGGLDDPPSWSQPWERAEGREYQRPENLRLLAESKSAPARKAASKNQRRRGPPAEAGEAPDSAYPDGNAADKAIRALQELKAGPFFLAVGFLKPHLPFCAPKRYWDLYERDSFPLPTNPFLPRNAPKFAPTTWGELRSYHGVPQTGPLSDEQARELIHAYHACVSFTDAQIGRVLDELDRLGLADNTIVILWGDHGWKLGEHGLWSKHTNFELDTRAPLLLRVPGARAKGAATKALVEFVDIYPSLCELAGLPLPEGLEGTSFASLAEDPDRPWKRAAFSQYPRGPVMGYSMRTDRYRYTEWTSRSGEVLERELYDHETDPSENENVAAASDRAVTVRDLADRLHAGWKAARPH